jgi:gliding motility-associated-like protein
LSIQLAALQGDPDPSLTFELWIFKQFNNDPTAPDWVISSIPFNTSTRKHTLDYNDPINEFLRVPGEYRLELKQIQITTSCGIVSSDAVTFTTPQPLSAKITGTKKSFPDIPTGELHTGDFVGGLTPYGISIELDSASSVTFPAYATQEEEVGLNINQQFEKIYKNLPPGRYNVMITDSLGCSIELVARVPLDTDILIPNVFTPNEDGTNDIFFIRNLPVDASAKLIVSNRWGKEVYASNNYQNNWNGEGAGDGVYFYRLQVKGSDTITGWVEIMRGQKP